MEQEATEIYDTGVFLNRMNRDNWFTESYYHRPAELAEELTDAGIAVTDCVALEGPLWILPDLAAARHDSAAASMILRVAAHVSRDQGGCSTSPHFLIVGRRP